MQGRLANRSVRLFLLKTGITLAEYILRHPVLASIILLALKAVMLIFCRRIAGMIASKHWEFQTANARGRRVKDSVLTKVNTFEELAEELFALMGGWPKVARVLTGRSKDIIGWIRRFVEPYVGWLLSGKIVSGALSMIGDVVTSVIEVAWADMMEVKLYTTEFINATLEPMERWQQFKYASHTLIDVMGLLLSPVRCLQRGHIMNGEAAKFERCDNLTKGQCTGSDMKKSGWCEWKGTKNRDQGMKKGTKNKGTCIPTGAGELERKRVIKLEIASGKLEDVEDALKERKRTEDRALVDYQLQKAKQAEKQKTENRRSMLETIMCGELHEFIRVDNLRARFHVAHMLIMAFGYSQCFD